ncbi:MAG: fibronectin type III domain-containing protein, partial [Kiritimatiellae bacterium]|nr:fibronectin type III domain-containing protein [Kiritimatiellia bacterium]
AKGCVSTFAVLQSHNTPNYEHLFLSSDTGGKDGASRWSISRHNNGSYWERNNYGSWTGTWGMYQNGVAGCPVTQSPFVLSCVGQWTRYSSDTIYLGALTAMTWGEVVLFSREVTDDERIGIEDYLMWKWGFKSEYLPFTASNYVTMAAGSTLDLGGFDLTVSSFYGCGTVENGTLRTADNVYWQGEGALTIPAVDGATYEASSSRYVLKITGAAGKSVTIRFPADWHDENDGKYTPVYCDGNPTFVFEGTEVPLFSDGAGGWCISSTDTGSYGENTEDDADEDEFEDEDGTAFPGAQGWGRFAKGARASSSPTVYHVTNLNDSGAGSLRDAVSKSNRIVVFDVGGLIKINSRITFASNLYIAGQTAPGEGITVYGDGCSFSGASNIICRYLRWRMGHGGSSGKDCAGIANGANMIFDHCSFSWGLDETFSINPDGKGTPPSNITLQNCIFGQGLMTHSAGGLMQGDYITLWRNLYVDNSTRNNKVKGINHYANNIVYNWKNGCYIMGGDSSGSSYCVIEGNLFINGPASSSSNALGGGNSDFHFYGADNWQDFNRNGKLDATCIDSSQTGGGDKVSTRYGYPVVPLYPGYELLEKNLRKVGASLPYRDPNDCYMVDEVESVGKSGGLITYESSLAIGAPDSWTWYGGTKKTNSDGDGIPDSWEEANGLDKANAADALWKASNGRLNIENYINSITAEDRELYLRPPFTLGAVSDTTTTIKLTWRDYTYGEIGFLVEKKVNGDWRTVYRCQPNTNYYRVTGLTPGTYYNLRVRAVGLENGSYVYSDPAEIYINTRSAPQTEVDIDTYVPDLHLAEGQSYWDGTHRYWVERTMFADGNKVLLDTETTQKVNIQSFVKPESIVVNGTGDLTLNKVGNIGEYEGSTDSLTSINKGNTGSLYLIGAGSYLGKIINHEGTIWFNSIADGGTASSLGASPNDAQYWVFDGGSYIYNGSSASSNRNLEFRRTSGLGVSG